jgi:hypothetical protein
MATGEWLADQFEEHRAHLRTMAYRMLGSASEAEDAVQETWIRLGRTDAGDIASLRRWLTTVVARVCLDMLRARTSRREDPLDVRLPDPIITRGELVSNQIVLVNGNVGLLARRPDGQLFAVIGFTIANGKVAEMNILADPDRLSGLDLSAIER